MPSKATVHGVLMDANLAPVVRGKIIATLNGSDMFEGGARIVTQKVEAATDAQGQWSMALLVNAEGDAAATSWTIEGYNEFVVKVFEAKSLFIATPLAIALGDLEKTSAQNLRAARDAGISRLLVVQSLAEYQALPEAQRRDSDIILVRGA